MDVARNEKVLKSIVIHVMDIEVIGAQISFVEVYSAHLTKLEALNSQGWWENKIKSPDTKRRFPQVSYYLVCAIRATIKMANYGMGVMQNVFFEDYYSTNKFDISLERRIVLFQSKQRCISNHRRPASPNTNKSHSEKYYNSILKIDDQL